MAQQKIETPRIKHQVYRTDTGKEVVLEAEADREQTADGSLGKVLSWLVREVKLERGEYVFGPPYDLAANRISPIGRVIVG